MNRMFMALLGLVLAEVAQAKTQDNFFYFHGKKTGFTYDTLHIESPLDLPITFASGAKAQIRSRVALQLKDNAHIRFLGLPLDSDVEVAAYRDGLYFINTGTPVEAIALANRLAQHKIVAFAHPIFRMPIEARSIDPTQEPLFPEQSHLQNSGQRGGTPGADMKVVEAWQQTTGRPEVKVALIDLGFEQDHPDLKDTWAVNAAEVPDNRKDDDGNGYIDDVIGWNFDTDNNKLLFGSVNKHGTATAGIIGARVNGQGVSGICPECKIIPMVIYTDIEDAAAAIYYARDQGASIISNSWGYRIGTPQTELLEQALTDVALNGRDGKGISILFAMPNHNSNACRESNPDISAHPHVIAVSGVDRHDAKVEETGFGPCLKFVGPTGSGKNDGLTTTDRVGENGYNTSKNEHEDLEDRDYTESFYGTSAATPAVAGAFALLYSANPDLTSEKALQAMIQSADKVSANEANYDPNGLSQMYGFGRPNVGKALEILRFAQDDAEF